MENLIKIVISITPIAAVVGWAVILLGMGYVVYAGMDWVVASFWRWQVRRHWKRGGRL